MKEETSPERQIPYVIIYMWNLKYDRNEPIYETETNSERALENRLVVAKGGKGWSGRLGLADVSVYIHNG